MEEQRLVSTGAAAAALGLNRRTLWRWISEGRIQPALKTAGGHLRWDVEELRAQLADGTPGPEKRDPPVTPGT